jgi:hypothetical protein
VTPTTPQRSLQELIHLIATVTDELESALDQGLTALASERAQELGLYAKEYANILDAETARKYAQSLAARYSPNP